MSKSRVLVWDLGRPGADRVSRIQRHLLGHKYETLVLAKVRSNSLRTLVPAFEDAGYNVLLGGASMQPSIVVASLHEAKSAGWTAPERYEHRWMPFKIGNIHALAVHIPYSGESEGREGKRRFWDAVLHWSKEHEDKPSMILGIFNTGLPPDSQGERFSLGGYIQDLLDQGWVDCWRRANPGMNDFGWFSHTGNGFRLDHCFFSKELAPALVDAEFDHEARLAGLSSSAPLVVTINVLLASQLGR